MTTLRDAAQQALEAMQYLYSETTEEEDKLIDAAITALKAALAEPEPPPEAQTEAEKIAYAAGWWKALEVNREKKAEPVQEPYCYVYEYDGAFGLHREFYPKDYNGHKPDRKVTLYIAPPQRKPLTDEEIQAIWAKTFESGSSANTFARAIERAHGIGGQDE